MERERGLNARPSPRGAGEDAGRPYVLQYDSGTILAQLRSGTRTLVQDLQFELAEGESLALIGETGSGKTMTARSILRLLPENVTQTGETIVFCGQPLPEGAAMRQLLGTQIVYIPQSGAEALDPLRTVGKQLADGLAKNGVPRDRRRKRAEELLTAAGLPEAERLLRAFPFELSGGMAQRVTIALAACAAPRLVIADEPTNGLDRRATEEFFRLLDRLFPKAARLIITHDISVAARCGRAAVLCGGIACETGPCAEVLSDPKHPYTRALLNALPQNGMAETPRLREGEAMCPFYARCPQARELCRTQMTPGAKGLRKWRCSGL